MDEQGMLQKIWAAQAGDEHARGQVAMYVHNKYKYRLIRLFQGYKDKDPAISLEDAEMTFFEGIMRAIPICDTRGNPLYHLGQRGIWAVKSELRAVERQVQRTFFQNVTVDGEPRDWTETFADRCAIDFCDQVVEDTDARRLVALGESIELRPRLRDLWEAIASGAAGDPEELGFNQRLAKVLGISAQRTSQLLSDLEGVLRDAQVTAWTDLAA